MFEAQDVAQLLVPTEKKDKKMCVAYALVGMQYALEDTGSWAHWVRKQINELDPYDQGALSDAIYGIENEIYKLKRAETARSADKILGNAGYRLEAISKES